MIPSSSRCTLTKGIFAVIIATFATIILDVRPFTDVGERFIGHADNADVAMVARNISEGNGAYTDSVWLLHGGGPPGPEVRHLEGYWSIYLAAYFALFFKIFGANLQAILLAASLVKVGIAAVSFHLVYQFTGRVFAATACAVVLLISPEMVSIVTGTSDIELTFFILLATICLVKTLANPSIKWWGLCGLCTGVAIGLKPSGILLFGLVPVMFIFASRWRQALPHAWIWVVVTLLALTPLAVHNYRAAGTILWPDLAVARSAGKQMNLNNGTKLVPWNTEWRHRWNSAAYDPTLAIGVAEAQGRDALKSYLEKFVNFCRAFSQGLIVPLWLLPFVFFAMVGCGWARLRALFMREQELPETELYQLFVAATSVLLIGACFLGSMVHIEVRYFAFLVPLFVVIGFVESSKLSPRFVAFGLLFTLLIATNFYYTTSAKPLKTDNVANYQLVNSLLPNDAVVMTSNPWEFSFHVRRPSVMLPYNDNADVIQEVANRFGIEYLAVVSKDVRHPRLQHFNDGDLPDYLETLHRTEDLIIARFLNTDDQSPHRLTSYSGDYDSYTQDLDNMVQ